MKNDLILSISNTDNRKNHSNSDVALPDAKYEKLNNSSKGSFSNFVSNISNIFDMSPESNSFNQTQNKRCDIDKSQLIDTLTTENENLKKSQIDSNESISQVKNNFHDIIKTQESNGRL